MWSKALLCLIIALQYLMGRRKKDAEEDKKNSIQYFAPPPVTQLPIKYVN